MSDNHGTGIYNIKAVVRLTGVAADTLRRWESRYNILAPQRSAGGYRMYSQHDVDMIRWLRARVDEGLTISRACQLLRTRQDGGARPDLGATQPHDMSPFRATYLPQGSEVQSLPALLQHLLRHLGALDEVAAGQVLSEALSLFSMEAVIEQLVYPLLVQVGEHWLSGEWTVAQEHFASAFLRARLANLLHLSPYNAAGPLVVVACAPEELHEIGALVVALYLRRAGYRVIYLGQNVPLDSLLNMIRTVRPAVVCCSAMRPNAASNLLPLRGMVDDLQRQTGHAPLLAYGGTVFNRHPQLAAGMGAVYLGASLSDAVPRLRAVLTAAL